jgi:hypothetical protein
MFKRCMMLLLLLTHGPEPGWLVGAAASIPHAVAHLALPLTDLHRSTALIPRATFNLLAVLEDLMPQEHPCSVAAVLAAQNFDWKYESEMYLVLGERREHLLVRVDRVLHPNLPCPPKYPLTPSPPPPAPCMIHLYVISNSLSHTQVIRQPLENDVPKYLLLVTILSILIVPAILRLRCVWRVQDDVVSPWSHLPPELWEKVLMALPAHDHQRHSEAIGWGGCKDSAAVRLVCKQIQLTHDTLARQLVLKHRATDEAVAVLMRRFPAVASVGMKGAAWGVLTDESLRAVSVLPALTSLDLTGCHLVTARGLRALSSCTTLTSLNLTCCNKVTDKTLRAVSILPALTSVDLRGCDKVTAAGVQALRSTTVAPSLRIEF